VRGVFVAALVVLGSLSVPLPAEAGGMPTIAGPAVAGYFDHVTLTGTTPTPGQLVTVYFRNAGSSTYTAGRRVTSDSSARFTVSYDERRSVYYYAQVGSAESAVRGTALVGARCAVSAPLFTHVPLLDFQPGRWRTPQLTDYASLSATANGVWAGTALTFNQSSVATVAVIRWAGGSKAQVLNSFAYRSSFPVFGENTAGAASVSIAGVTHAGAVVAAVAGSSAAASEQMFQGLVWANGQRYRLRAPSGWSVHPTGVYGLSGSIVGWVRNGPLSTATHSYAVVWPTPTSAYTAIGEIAPGYEPFTSTDGEGDVAYVDTHLHSQVNVSGTDFPLTGTTGDNNGERIFGGPGTHFYGSQGGPLLRWDVQYPTTSGIRPERAIAPRDETMWIAAAGTRGDVIIGWDAGKQHLRTSYGAYPKLPSEPILNLGSAPDTAIDSNGAVAFTSTADSLVHLFRCAKTV